MEEGNEKKEKTDEDDSMSGTILGDLVKKWFERKKNRKKEREKKKERNKKGGKNRYWSREAEESIVSHLFLENNLATRCEGVKNSGVKGRASTYRGSTDEQTRMKKEGEESEGRGQETDGKGGREGGRRKWKRRKDGSKKRGTVVERRARIQRACTMCRGKSARGRERERKRRKEAKQRGPIKAESDLNLSKDWCTRNLVINE